MCLYHVDDDDDVDDDQVEGDKSDNGCDGDDTDEDQDLNVYSEKKGSTSKASISKTAKKPKSKPGRKAKWNDKLLCDLVDIVVNSDYYKSKLIFTNTKNQKNGEIYSKILSEIKRRAANRNESVTFTPEQVRTRFKKAVGVCKKAALTIKTATGIKRFQDEKGYGQWFDSLYSFVKTRDSCQPQLALEPSATMGNSNETEIDGGESSTNLQPKLFVPVKTWKKKGKKKEDEMLDVLTSVKTALDNDPMKDFITFMSEEAERSRQHELKIIQLLMQQPVSQPMPETTQPRTVQSAYLGSTMQTAQSPSHFIDGYNGPSSPWMNFSLNPDSGRTYRNL